MGSNVPWNQVGAAFGAMLDSLLKHYRGPDSMFGPDSERMFARFGKFMGDALSTLSLILDIGRTLADKNLNVGQKIVKIVGAATSAIAVSIIGAAVGAYFASPVVAILLAMLLVVLMATLIDLLVGWIVGAIAAVHGRIKRQLFSYEYV